MRICTRRIPRARTLGAPEAAPRTNGRWERLTPQACSQRRRSHTGQKPEPPRPHRGLWASWRGQTLHTHTELDTRALYKGLSILG
jgi:hypothetical protein